MRNIFISIPILLLLTACGGKSANDELAATSSNSNTITLTEAQLKNAAITTGRMEQKEISSILKLNGKIDVPPQNMVSVSVPLGGYLKSTKLLPGMHINKGEVIAIVEDQQYIQLQQDYLTAKAKISFLENEYKRQKELNQSQASSDKVYQLAEAEYNGQRVLISALAEKLKLAGINPARLNENTIARSVNIYSPISGFVSKVNVNIGKYVSPTEVLFELINPADIHLALKVFEKDLSKLFIGQKLTAYTNNQPEKKHSCEILLVGKDLSTDRSTDIHCHFESYDKTLVPGTYMNAEIEVKSKLAFVLPENAIVRFEGKQYIFIKEAANRFMMTPIEAGVAENGYTEIVSVSKPSDKEVVINGAYSLLMMLKNKSDE
jgi:membrane fusion protein, heavy metal efflux system